MNINKTNNYPDYPTWKEKAVMELDKKAMQPEVAQVVEETKQSINELSLEAKILLEKQLALTLYKILTTDRKESAEKVNKILAEYWAEWEKLKEQPETLTMNNVMKEAEMYFWLAEMNRERQKYNNAKALDKADTNNL